MGAIVLLCSEALLGHSQPQDFRVLLLLPHQEHNFVSILLFRMCVWGIVSFVTEHCIDTLHFALWPVVSLLHSSLSIPVHKAASLISLRAVLTCECRESLEVNLLQCPFRDSLLGPVRAPGVALSQIYRTRDVFSPPEWALNLFRELYFGISSMPLNSSLRDAILYLTLGKPWLSGRNVISYIDTS